MRNRNRKETSLRIRDGLTDRINLRRVCRRRGILQKVLKKQRGLEMRLNNLQSRPNLVVLVRLNFLLPDC